MSKYRNNHYGQKLGYDMDEEEGAYSIKEYRNDEARRKEKRLKNALRSKDISALLDEDEYE